MTSVGEDWKCIFAKLKTVYMQELQDRVIISWGNSESGPLLCFFAGIHGNEPAGVLALERVQMQLHELDLPFHGKLIGLRGNLHALNQNQRYIDVDLNRLWSKEEIRRIFNLNESERNTEEKELIELLALIDSIREASYAPQIFVDLHTTSAKGGAFSVVASDSSHRALAECLPVPMIFGLAPALAHTTNRFFEDNSLIGIAFEAGQHDDPVSVDRHEAAVWTLLVSLGCMNAADVPEWEHKQALLKAAAGDLSLYQNVAYRHEISDDQEFSMMPGFLNFQDVFEGQPLGFDKHGEIFCPEDGRILMPLYQPQGHDGFFVIQDLDEPPV